MKKILALLLAAVMLFSLAACTSSVGNETNPPRAARPTPVRRIPKIRAAAGTPSPMTL